MAAVVLVNASGCSTTPERAKVNRATKGENGNTVKWGYQWAIGMGNVQGISNWVNWLLLRENCFLVIIKYICCLFCMKNIIRNINNIEILLLITIHMVTLTLLKVGTTMLTSCLLHFDMFLCEKSLVVSFKKVRKLDWNRSRCRNDVHIENGI